MILIKLGDRSLYDSEHYSVQVEQVLTIEEFLPQKLRRQFTTGWWRVNPNIQWRNQFTMRCKRSFHGESWRHQFAIACREVGLYLKGLWRERILFVLWGGERYDTRASIEKVLHPQEVCCSYKALACTTQFQRSSCMPIEG